MVYSVKNSVVDLKPKYGVHKKTIRDRVNKDLTYK